MDKQLFYWQSFGDIYDIVGLIKMKVTSPKCFQLLNKNRKLPITLHFTTVFQIKIPMKSTNYRL